VRVTTRFAGSITLTTSAFAISCIIPLGSSAVSI